MFGVVLAVVLLAAREALHRPHHSLLDQLNQRDLPRIAEFSQASIQLVQNHSRLVEVLVSAIEHQDEERVYIDGRETLDALHTIEARLLQNLLLETHNTGPNHQTSERVESFFRAYRDSSISAIELSTVNSSRARVELLSAQKSLDSLLGTLLQRTDFHVNELQASASLIESSNADEGYILWLAVTFVVFMIVSAIYFSSRMTRDLDKLNRALMSLSTGDTNVDLPKRADP